MAKDISFKITEHIATLSGPNKKGWSKELNLVEWDNRPAVYDIRSWNEDHDQMSKGITMTKEELLAIVEADKNGLIN